MERMLKQLHLTLPATYDDSLSYYEAICKLEKHLNNVIEEIEALNNEAIRDANAYTDSKIAELTKTKSDLESALIDYSNKVDHTKKQIGA